MQLEVLTPDTLLYKGDVNSIVLPGTDGYFGILNNHAPLISALANGEVTVKQDPSKNTKENIEGEIALQNKENAEFSFAIKGGVVEVNKNKIIVLAE